MGFQRQSNWMGKSDGGPKTDQIVQEKILRQANNWSTKNQRGPKTDQIGGEKVIGS